MTDFRAVIDRWPSLTEFSSDMGTPYGTAKQWRLRNSVPNRRWPRLCKVAAKRGFRDITLDRLFKIAARPAAPRIHTVPVNGVQPEQD